MLINDLNEMLPEIDITPMGNIVRRLMPSGNIQHYIITDSYMDYEFGLVLKVHRCGKDGSLLNYKGKVTIHSFPSKWFI